MANWCQHQLSFSGEAANVEKAFELFKGMQSASHKEGQKPACLASITSDWFFNIAIEDDMIYYETKWADNAPDVLLVAIHCNVGFDLTYQESGNGVYGRAIRNAETGEYKKMDLDNEDISQYEFDDENDRYVFEGEEYECEEDILETLFLRKFGIDY